MREGRAQSLWILLALVFGVPKKFSGGSVAAAKIFSHRGRAVTTEGEGCGERSEVRRNVSGEPS